eukprot:3790488-Rhodomonas_salina.1
MCIRDSYNSANPPRANNKNVAVTVTVTRATSKSESNWNSSLGVFFFSPLGLHLTAARRRRGQLTNGTPLPKPGGATAGVPRARGRRARLRQLDSE